MQKFFFHSLTKRILLTAILLLVIPLFIQSLLLYYHEYHHIEDYYFHFATLVFFVVVVGGGAVYLLTRRIERPLKELCTTMDRVASGASHMRYKPDRMGFEINALGLQFNATLDAMERHAKEAEEERGKRAKLSETLAIGHTIQANLLPSHVPGIKGVQIETRYIASQEVSGDFYDLFQLEDGRLLVGVADVAGKGISACLYSLGLRSMVRSLASLTPDLSTLIRKVNDLYLIDAQESAMFATIWLGIFDPKSQKLIYCSQGHPPAMLRRGSKIEELGTGGLPLGAQEIERVATQEIQLGKGDILLIYSDGIIESHNRHADLFGKGRLIDCLKEAKHEVAESIVEAVRAFSQGTIQHDDLTLVALHL